MPHCPRARLWLVGDDGQELPDLGETIGIRADGGARIGEVAPGTVLPTRRTIWWIEEKAECANGDAFANAVEACLDRLLARLECADAGRRLRDSGLSDFATISLGGFCSDIRDANIEYTRARLQRLAALGLTLEEDFYQLTGTE